MGLDTFAVVSDKTDKTDTELNSEGKPVVKGKHFAGIVLCGGMLSGNGAGGSFRGKVYADYIERVTGISLYQEEMSLDDVGVIAYKLEKVIMEAEKDGLANTDIVDHEWDTTYEDVVNLQKWFQVCSDYAYHVSGWW